LRRAVAFPAVASTRRAPRALCKFAASKQASNAALHATRRLWPPASCLPEVDSAPFKRCTSLPGSNEVCRAARERCVQGASS
jgi:hypothetical protein